MCCQSEACAVTTRVRLVLATALHVPIDQDMYPTYLSTEQPDFGTRHPKVDWSRKLQNYQSAYTNCRRQSQRVTTTVGDRTPRAHLCDETRPPLKKYSLTVTTTECDRDQKEPPPKARPCTHAHPRQRPVPPAHHACREKRGPLPPTTTACLLAARGTPPRPNPHPHPHPHPIGDSSTACPNPKALSRAAKCLLGSAAVSGLHMRRATNRRSAQRVGGGETWMRRRAILFQRSVCAGRPSFCPWANGTDSES